MIINISPFSSSLFIFCLLIFFSFASAFDLHRHYQDHPDLGKGSCSDFESEPSSSMATLGGLRESEGVANDAEIEGLARFAVDEHNKKEVPSPCFSHLFAFVQK